MQKLLPEMEESVRSTLRLISRLERELEELDEQRKKEVQQVAEKFKGRRSEKKTQRTQARRSIETLTRMSFEELEKVYGNSAPEIVAESELEQAVDHESAA